MNKLDELFQEKLTHHTVTPSPEAWRKIESGLSRAAWPAIWLRGAAVFLLGGLLLSLLWLRRTEVPPAITKSNVPKQVDVQKPAQAILDMRNTETVQKTEKVENAQKKKSTDPALPKQVPAGSAWEAVVQTDITATEEPVSLPDEAETTQSQANSPIVLVYTLESIESSNLTSPGPVIADAADKKDSSLKRVLEFANTVKNSESPLDNLRSAKEELFAFDFKKKTNSKKQ